MKLLPGKREIATLEDTKYEVVRTPGRTSKRRAQIEYDPEYDAREPLFTPFEIFCLLLGIIAITLVATSFKMIGDEYEERKRNHASVTSTATVTQDVASNGRND